jgi:Na+/H+ antiporter NhaC
MKLIIASFISVFVKAFQQRNVAFNNYISVPLFSFGMAFTEVYIIINIVNLGASWDVIWKLAVGAALGCWTAMYLHNKLHNREGEDRIEDIFKEKD